MIRLSRFRRLIITAGITTAFAAQALTLPAEPTTSKLEVVASTVHSQKTGDTAVNGKTVKVYTTTFANAKITHKDAVFSADSIVMLSKGDDQHEFTCTGNPVFTDPENRITADRVIGYSNPRRAEFQGHVKMVSTPKRQTATKNDLRDTVAGEPSTTTCDQMSYDYAAKTARATGNVMVVQKERTVWADQAIYDQKLELITLTGNVRMKNSGDAELKSIKDAQTVTVSLQDDWIDISGEKDGQPGLVTMEFEVKDE